MTKLDLHKIQKWKYTPILSICISLQRLRVYEELQGGFFTAPLHFQYSNEVTSAAMFYIDLFEKVVLIGCNSFFIFPNPKIDKV